jgi:hypothetical protein
MASTLRGIIRLRAGLTPRPCSSVYNHLHYSPRPLITFAYRQYATDVKVRMSEGAVKRSSVSEVIKQDHRELEQYYNQIISSTDHDVQTRYQNLFVWELARHSVGEEIVVYPVMEKQLADGKKIADQDRKEHAKGRASRRTMKRQEKGADNSNRSKSSSRSSRTSTPATRLSCPRSRHSTKT